MSTKILNYEEQKKYSSMSFLTMNSKLFLMVNNNASYNKQTF